MKTLAITVLTLTLGLALVVSASASVVVTSWAEEADTVPLTNDLVNSGQSTLSSVTLDGSVRGGSLSNINDGTQFDGSTRWSQNGILVTSQNATLTFYLSTTLNTLGYDITEIDVRSGYYQYGSSQYYTVQVRQVGNTNFVNITDVAVAWYPYRVSDQAVSVTDTTGTVASGVDAVRFSNIREADPLYIGEYPYLQEIDVVGTATALVPEPSALLAITTGLLGLAGFSIRRKKIETAGR